MFGMTSKDAENLALGLKICKKIKVLRINNSKIDDDKFYQLIDGFRVLAQLGDWQVFVTLCKIYRHYRKKFLLCRSAETTFQRIDRWCHVWVGEIDEWKMSCQSFGFDEQQVSKKTTKSNTT